jgi:hypothetical protein
MDLNLQINQMLKNENEKKKHELKKKEMNFCLTLCRGLDIFV